MSGPSIGNVLVSHAFLFSTKRRILRQFIRVVIFYAVDFKGVFRMRPIGFAQAVVADKTPRCWSMIECQRTYVGCLACAKLSNDDWGVMHEVHVVKRARVSLYRCDDTTRQTNYINFFRKPGMCKPNVNTNVYMWKTRVEIIHRFVYTK